MTDSVSGTAPAPSNYFGLFRRELADRAAREREPKPRPAQKAMAMDPVIKYLIEDELPAALHGKEQDHARLYPAFAPLDKGKKFPLAAVHSGDTMYRKKDIPVFKPTEGKDWTGKFNALLVLNNDSKTAFGHPLVSWDATDSNGIDPRDIFVRIKPHTQMPSIQVSIVTKRYPNDMNGSQVPPSRIKCIIYAHSLTREESEVGIRFNMGQDAVEHENTGNQLLTPAIEKLTSDCTLCSLHLDLIDLYSERPTTGALGRPVWIDIELSKIEEYCSRLRDPWHTLTPAESLIARLRTATQATFYFALPKPRFTDNSFLDFSKFTRAVFYLTATIGTFWYYRLAFPGIEKFEPDYPYSEIPPPRWLHQKWRVCYQDDVATSSELFIADTFPEVTALKCPDKTTIPFMARLGLRRDQPKLAHNL